MKSYMAAIISLMAAWTYASDMQEYLSTTRQMTRMGQYEEALERHIWFHDNVLSHDPAMYGVRLSFALSYWKELADKYPPAMDALVELRDRIESRVREGGDSRAFHDLVALNNKLDREQNTIEVFDYLDREHPAIARRAWHIAKDTVIDAQRYDLARKYIEDPVREFAKVKTMYEHNVTLYENPEVGGEHFREYNEGKLVRDSLKLISVALSLNDRDSAMKIRDMALEIVEHKSLRDAVPGLVE